MKHSDKVNMSTKGIPSLLLDEVTELVVFEEWLVWLHVNLHDEKGEHKEDAVISNDRFDVSPTLLPPMKKQRQLKFLVSTDVTVAQVKNLVELNLQVRLQDQRLYVPPKDDEEQKAAVALVHGAVVPQLRPPAAVGIRNTPACELSLNIVPLDPTLEALFVMVGLGSVDDREEYLSRLVMAEEPNDVTSPHVLNPYPLLHFRALAAATEMMEVGCWFGDTGHNAMSSHPIPWPGPVQPFPPRTTISVDFDTQVLWKNVRLKIVLDEETQSMLNASQRDAKDTREEQLLLDKVLPDGATIRDMISYRQILVASPLWPIICRQRERQLEQQRAELSEDEEDDLVAQWFWPDVNNVRENPVETAERMKRNACMSLVSSSLEEIVFSIRAR